MSEPVILYSAAGCDESPKVRAWLIDRSITFVERDVSDDAEAAMALAGTGIFATPLLVGSGWLVLGFRPDEIAATLARHGVDVGAV